MTERPMPDRRGDVDVALAYVAALGGDDPATVVDLVSDDFRNEHHAELGSGCVGRDEYARRLPGFFATFSNRHYDVVEASVGILVDDGSTSGSIFDPDRSADSESDDDRDSEDRWAGRGGGSEVVVRYRFGADIEGTRIDIPGVMWISVRNDRVTRRLDCWDSLTFHRQTGTAPAL